MQRFLGLPIPLLLLAGCGSSDSDSSSIPPAAASLQSYEKAGVTLIVPRLARFEGRLPFLLNPGSAGANGLVFQPDASPGAPPNAYLFTVPLDGNGDGIDETTLDGSAAFNGDPATAGIGFGGHLDFTIVTVGGLGNFAGNMDFTIVAQGSREISGSGTFTEGLTGNVTTLTVDPVHPMTMQAAHGGSSSVANACYYSLDGNAQLDVAGSAGTLSSTWGFQSTRSTAAVTGVEFTDNSGHVTPLPNSNVTIPCGANGSINDWAGVFLQNWACLPIEFGQATLTLAKSGSNKISISDEDPPASGDVATYEASVVSANPHAVRGFFIGGDPGFTYREDFSWTLSSSGDDFSQISFYTYLEGPNQGHGGICGGVARRQP
jgi:hypothetical protein